MMRIERRSRMSSRDLIPFTKRRDTSSAGASPTRYIRLFNQSQLPDTLSWVADISQNYVAWGQSTTSGDFAHLLVWRPSPSGTTLTSLTPQLEKRVMCHALLSVLPDEALPKVCESLIDYYDAYFGPIVTSSRIVSAPQKASAKTSSKRLRAEFRVPEE